MGSPAVDERAMQITSLETVEIGADADIGNPAWELSTTLLRVHTDEGVVGLGETYPLAGVEAGAIHGPVADEVLGRDPRDVEAIRDDLLTYFNFYGHAGAEMRAMSALDIALWDVKGRAAGEPVYGLLGGRTREEIPVYNTCAPPYDFRDDPAGVAESLLEEGITAMKVWPFDPAAEETRGQRITTEGVERGLEPIRAIREAVGDAMDVAVECHSRWSLPAAKRIADAIEPYDPLWLEDAVRKGDFDAYRRLGEAVDVPLCLSERLIGRYEYEQALRTGAIDVVKLDVEWTGGFSEALAVANVAEAQHLPVAPHAAGGPVLQIASAHLATAVPNLYVLESVRGWYDGWHREILTEGIDTEDGAFPAPPGPGLGTELRPSVLDHPDTEVRESTL